MGARLGSSQDGVELLCDPIGLVGRQDQRRRDADGVVVGLLCQQSPRLHASQTGRAPPASGSSSTAIIRPRPRTSFTRLEWISASCAQPLAHPRGVFDHAFLDQHLQRRARHGAGQRVAAVSRAMLAGMKHAHPSVFESTADTG